jgi:hypothetical protein
MATLLGGAYLARYVLPGSPVGTVAVLTVTAPDGTTTTPAVTATGTLGSIYTATVPATLAGTYLLVWTATGTVVDAVADQFSVIVAGLDLANLHDVKTELRLSQVDTTYDEQLRTWLKAATAVVENITGPILPAHRVDVMDGGNDFFVLPFRWVQSIQDLHETRGVTNYVLTEQPLGSATNAWGYTWDRNTGMVVRRTSTSAPMNFPDGTNVVSVSYTLGMLTIPEDIQMAAKKLVKHWFGKSDQPFRAAFTAQPAEDMGMTNVGNYMVPNELIEILEPWRRRPGIF